MDIKHVKNFSIATLIALTITPTALSTKILPRNTDNTTVMSPQKSSKPYVQILNLNDAGGNNFTSDPVKISNKGQKNLNTFLERIISSGITPSTIFIVGYTDNIGSKKENKHTSEQHASTVADYLVNQGLDGALMHVTGLGETHPIASNDSQAGRAQNRRVFIRIHGNKQPQ